MHTCIRRISGRSGLDLIKMFMKSFMKTSQHPHFLVCQLGFCPFREIECCCQQVEGASPAAAEAAPGLVHSLRALAFISGFEIMSTSKMLLRTIQLLLLTATFNCDKTWQHLRQDVSYFLVATLAQGPRHSRDPHTCEVRSSFSALPGYSWFVRARSP